MSTKRKISGVFATLFSVYFKFVNSSQYNSEYCDTYVGLLRMLSADLQLSLRYCKPGDLESLSLKC
jgi:hypothetical protein